MSTWSDMQAQLELAVDGLYGENIRLLPYKGKGGGYTSNPERDLTREARDAVGYDYSKAVTMDSRFTSKRASADMLFAVQDKYMVGIRDHDRVVHEDGTTWEISYIEPSTNYRSVLHLLKVKEL